MDEIDFASLHKLMLVPWYEFSEKDNPEMADSIGSLADKLATVNFKMAFNQEILYATRRQTPEEFQAAWDGKMPELYNVLKRCTDLNVQRSRLVDEIDKKLAAMFKGDVNPSDLVNPQHKTY